MARKSVELNEGQHFLMITHDGANDDLYLNHIKPPLHRWDGYPLTVVFDGSDAPVNRKFGLASGWDSGDPQKNRPNINLRAWNYFQGKPSSTSINGLESTWNFSQNTFVPDAPESSPDLVIFHLIWIESLSQWVPSQTPIAVQKS